MGALTSSGTNGGSSDVTFLTVMLYGTLPALPPSYKTSKGPSSLLWGILESAVSLVQVKYFYGYNQRCGLGYWTHVILQSFSKYALYIIELYYCI